MKYLVYNTITNSIVSFDSLIRFYKVYARSGLVTQTPDNYRRMVNGGVYHFHVSCYSSVLEFWHVRQARLAIVVLMAFDVSLVFEVDTVLIA